MTSFRLKRSAPFWLSFLLAPLLASCNSGARGDLDADSQLALEIGVVSVLASPRSMFPVTVSDSLMDRVQKLEGIHRDVSTYGMIGAGRIISDGGGRFLVVTISGPVNASVTLSGGEVGLKEGEIYITEGTLLTDAEGVSYSFTDGRWREGMVEKPVAEEELEEAA